MYEEGRGGVRGGGTTSLLNNRGIVSCPSPWMVDDSLNGELTSRPLPIQFQLPHVSPHAPPVISHGYQPPTDTDHRLPRRDRPEADEAEQQRQANRMEERACLEDGWPERALGTVEGEDEDLGEYLRREGDERARGGGHRRRLRGRRHEGSRGRRAGGC